MTGQSQRVLGLVCAVFAGLVLAVWIPLDTDTGLTETVRRRTQIGDAFAPTLAAVFVLIGGLLTLLRPGTDDGEEAPKGALRFGVALLACLVLGYLVTLYAGPFAVWMANRGRAEPLEYRLLRGDVPWKYLGFILGGTSAVAGSIALTEGRMSPRALAIGLGAVLGMILLFDVPFDDLLLPPNGDF